MSVVVAISWRLAKWQESTGALLSFRRSLVGIGRFHRTLVSGEEPIPEFPTALEMPNLVQVQLESFDWFRREGLRELLDEISPITDHHKKMELSIFEPRFDPPWHRMPEGEEQERAKIDPRVCEVWCRERDMTYAAPLRVSARLVMHETGEIKETGPDGIFLGDFPMMTTDGTFIINGAERVVVSQLVRSPGVYFDRVPDPAIGQAADIGQVDPEPRRLARIRDIEPRHHFGQGRSQAQDAGHDPAARAWI